jgi:hypothetical protein
VADVCKGLDLACNHRFSYSHHAAKIDADYKILIDQSLIGPTCTRGKSPGIQAWAERSLTRSGR